MKCRTVIETSTFQSVQETVIYFISLLVASLGNPLRPHLRFLEKPDACVYRTMNIARSE